MKVAGFIAFSPKYIYIKLGSSLKPVVSFKKVKGNVRPACLLGLSHLRLRSYVESQQQSVFGRTRSTVNNKNQLPASHSFKQVQRGVLTEHAELPDTPGFSPRGDGCGSSGARSDSGAPTRSHFF